jgi:hypothetical protein
MLRKTHEAKRREWIEERAYVSRAHKKDLDGVAETARSLVHKLSRVTFDRSGDRYRIIIDMDDRMMSAVSESRGDLSMVADMIASQVRNEIASSRFVASARQAEIQRMDSAYDQHFGAKP